MTVLEASILGLVQGITEFLPVSSSGHLVLFQQLFGLHQETLVFDVLLHLATLLAILAYFGRDLLMVSRREWLLIGLATLPTVVVGLLFKDAIEGLFAYNRLIGIELMITGGINFFTDWKLGVLNRQSSTLRTQPTPVMSGVIGLAQAVAIIPGISRSGSTVAAGIGQGLARESAFRFSFLMAIPALVGAGVLQLASVVQADGVGIGMPLSPLFAGCLVAFASGLLSLNLFKYVMTKAHFEWFGWYCLLMGGVALFIL